MTCVVGAFREERLVGRRELDAHREGEDAADREEDERRQDVEDPDALVVDRRQPRRHLARAPVGAEGAGRLGVDRHYCVPPFAYCFVQEISASSWSLDQFLPTAGILPRPFRSSVSIPFRSASREFPPSAGPMYAWSRRWQVRHDADPLLLPEPGAARVRLARGDELVVLGSRHDVDDGAHQRVLDAAELRAARDVRPRGRLEPRVIRPSRDRVVLAAEVGDPPRVDDVVVVALDPLVHHLVGRRDHAVDRDRAVRIAEEPVELMALDRDRGLVGGCRLRCVRDPGQLVEDETTDHGEDHDRDDRPDDLEARRAVDLRPFDRPCALAAAVLDDEGDERAFDDHEDHAGEDRDDDEGVVDAMRVRRVRLSG